MKDMHVVKILVKDSNPDNLISIVDSLKFTSGDDLKGLCYYDSRDKTLNSHDTIKALFYYDSYHGVLEIQYSESLIHCKD